MPDPFQNSDQIAEQAHQLYLAGRYDDALSLLRNGLEIFPLNAELHLGCGYARLAREEFAWARHAFEEALSLEPNHEDALAGLGETLLKLGQRDQGLSCFDRILALGFREDHDLMLQVGRALFREGLFDHSRRYFDLVVTADPECAEGVACLGFAIHRLGDDEGAEAYLQRALALDGGDVEARIYLGNLLYDRGQYEEALEEFERTEPDDHVEELALWRVMELKKAFYRLEDTDPEVLPWMHRLEALAAEIGPEERLLAEIEATLPDGSFRDPQQLDFFSTLLSELRGMKKRDTAETHRVSLPDGTMYTGSWDDIVLQMKQDDRNWAGCSLVDYMEEMARRSQVETGIVVPATDAESFLRGIAAAGLVRIAR